MIGRREFITLLGGAAAWPVPARAQQPNLPVVGFLNSGSPGAFEHFVIAFRQGLGEAGYVEHRNVGIDYRWAEGQVDRLPALARELVRAQVAVICAGGPPTALAAKAATTTIPIVFTSGEDPVKLGLVASYNRPGGNVTGVALLVDVLGAKRLGLLREIVPAATLIAVLLNPSWPTFDTQLNDVQEAARAVGQQIHVLRANTEREIDAAFDTAKEVRAGAMMVGPSTFFTVRRDQIVGLAARDALPTIYGQREFMAAGALMSYATNLADAYRQAGVYSGKILGGARPAELPVVQSAKFELVINLKIAKSLGLTLPARLARHRRRGDRMKRRQFITLLGGAALAGALPAAAQKGTALIGLLGSGSAHSSGIFVDSLKEGLSDGGLREGRDYVLDLRWAEGNYERFPALARELVERKADVILATTISAVRAAQRATAAIPIVMTSITNAVGAGLVASLARPGGNTTGISNLNEDLTPKLLDHFREIMPRARVIASLGNPANPSTRGLVEVMRGHTAAFGATVNPFEAKAAGELDAAFDGITKSNSDALLIVPDNLLIDLREPIASLALKHRIPTLSTIPELTDAGGLLGYGPPRRDLYRRSGYFVKRILDGANPGDMPVEQPTRVQLSINTKTAAVLGISIPDALLGRADKVIE